jgi:hypothetical protein
LMLWDSGQSLIKHEFEGIVVCFNQKGTTLVAMFPSPDPECSQNKEQHLRRIFTLNCSRNAHVPGPERRNVEQGT